MEKSRGRILIVQPKTALAFSMILPLIILGSLFSISLMAGGDAADEKDFPKYFLTQSGDKNSSIVLSSPPDIKVSPNDTQARITWDIVLINAFGDSWELLLNGDLVESGFLVGNTTQSFNISQFLLASGSHNFSFIATGLGYDNSTVSEEDSVFVHVIYTKKLDPGIHTIFLEGVPESEIIPTVNQTLDFTITPSSTPIAGSEQALNEFQLENPKIVLTHYYLEIGYSLNGVSELWINISYLNWNLIDRLGIDPSTLRILAFDPTSSTWDMAGTTGVDLESKVVFTHINPPNTSFTVGGSAPTLTGGTGPPPIQTTTATTPGFDSISFLVIVAVGLEILRRRLPKGAG
ncbi:MAG: hypothetical protein ACFFE8_10095 [Candidatus Heimdallarchaeota archaeon]